MENQNAVNWFEIPVMDMGRARDFYTAVFQTEMVNMPSPNSEMWAFQWYPGAPNSAGCIIKSEGYAPSLTATTVYFACENIVNELERVEGAGGKVLLPRTSIGEFGFIAHVEDSEGNRIGLHNPA